MADRDEGTSSAAPGGEQVAAGMGDSGSYNARPPGGETPRTNAIVNAELQVEQLSGMAARTYAVPSPLSGAQ